MTSGTDPVDELFAELIAALEEDPETDVERFLEGHASHAAALRKRIEKLRAAGFLGSSPQVGNLLHEMRERFGVRSAVRTASAARGDGTEPEQSELLPSRVIGGRYRILGELGRGGMGRVFRALDVDLDREVALKVADLEEVLPGAGTPQKRVWIERFLSEAQVTAQLEHPSIVPVHDIGIDRTGQLFYTMKVVEGKTLARCIDDWHMGLADGRPFPTAELLRIVLQVCNALAFAHERGVVHRDLKPSNVMVGRFGEVQVMDWGLAKLLGSSEASAPPVRSARKGSGYPTRVGDVLGTPTHMAPEQAQGDPNAIDFRADVFGIGAILHHALHGFPPNRGSEASDGALGVVGQWKVPAELAAICQRALQPDPRLRYASASQVAEDLSAYLDQRVVTAYETGAWAELRKWVRRNRAFAVSASAGFLALLAGLILSLYLRSEAVARRNEVFQLSSLQDLDDLVNDAGRLWPPYPENVQQYESWVMRAKHLVDKLPEHEKKLAEVRAKAVPAKKREAMQRSGFELTEKEKPSEPDWTFASSEDKWWHGQLAKLVDGLKALSDPATGLLSFGISPGNGWGVVRRFEFARTIRERSVGSQQASASWCGAIASISDPEQCPMYDGLRIAPQLGLLPIGRDPGTGLWEFAHLQMGEPPKRDGDGKLVLSEETGLVLVLLPGGTFYMGAQKEDKSGRNYDPMSRPNEGPVRSVAVRPFFMSKFELTQGQWVRTTGLNPSVTPAGRNSEDGHSVNNLHPVESVCWTDCCSILERLQLTLPTEAQWEYSARGGTTTPWWSGSDVASLQGTANLKDVSLVGLESKPTTATPIAWDDGYADVHAPIGSFAPNPFGLHDVLGNVQEWCLDLMKGHDGADGPKSDYEKTAVAGHVVKGGGFFSDAVYVRCSSRDQLSAVNRNGGMGLRPARPIDAAPPGER